MEDTEGPIQVTMSTEGKAGVQPQKAGAKKKPRVDPMEDEEKEEFDEEKEMDDEDADDEEVTVTVFIGQIFKR